MNRTLVKTQREEVEDFCLGKNAGMRKREWKIFLIVFGFGQEKGAH